MVDFSFSNSAAGAFNGFCAASNTYLLRAVEFSAGSPYTCPLQWVDLTPTNTPQSSLPLLIIGRANETPLTVIPFVCSNFPNGTWSGGLTITQAANNVYLRALDAKGYGGLSGVFDVMATARLDIDGAIGSPDPSAGTHYYPTGTNITCSIAGSPVGSVGTQYVCTGWAGSGDAGSGGGTSVTFTLNNNSAVSWNWTTNYWLNIAIAGDGGVNGASAWEPAGSARSLTATASNYWYFTNWSGNIPSGHESSNPIALPMTQARWVQCRFLEHMAANSTPQWWLSSYGWTNNFDSAATNDCDGDGLQTWQEWIANSDPTNRDSVLTCVPGAATDRTAWVISWQSRPDCAYRILFSTNLIDGFSALATNLVYPQNAYTDTINKGATPIYYRIDVRRQ
jgi:hypothetical protein